MYNTHTNIHSNYSFASARLLVMFKIWNLNWYPLVEVVRLWEPWCNVRFYMRYRIKHYYSYLSLYTFSCNTYAYIMYMDMLINHMRVCALITFNFMPPICANSRRFPSQAALPLSISLTNVLWLLRGNWLQRLNCYEISNTMLKFSDLPGAGIVSGTSLLW